MVVKWGEITRGRIPQRQEGLRERHVNEAAVDLAETNDAQANDTDPGLDGNTVDNPQSRRLPGTIQNHQVIPMNHFFVGHVP